MIKLISFNNFDNFDAKSNTSFGEKEDLAQDFTAVFNIFAPPMPEVKTITQSVRIINSDDKQLFVKNPVQEQVFGAEEPENLNEKTLTFYNENPIKNLEKIEIKSENKPEFINQTGNAEKLSSQIDNGNMSPEKNFSVDLNPAAAEKLKESRYKPSPDLFERLDPLQIENFTEIKSENYLEMNNFEESSSEFNTQIKLDLPIENQQRSDSNQISGMNEQTAINLENFENKIDFPFLKIRNREIISLETSVKNVAKPENYSITEAGEINFSIKNEMISAGKVLTEEDLNHLSEKFESRKSAPENAEIADSKLDEFNQSAKESKIPENKKSETVTINPKTENIKAVEAEQRFINEKNHTSNQPQKPDKDFIQADFFNKKANTDEKINITMNQFEDAKIADQTIKHQIQNLETDAPVQLRTPLVKQNDKSKFSERLVNKMIGNADGFNNKHDVLQDSQKLSSNLNLQNDTQKNGLVSDQISPLQGEQKISKTLTNSAESPIYKTFKSPDFASEFSGVSFETLLKKVSNERQNIETESKFLSSAKTVIDQIEPKIIELASFVQKSDEKQLLKMRLNPAELGEVEIKLEKDAAGKITAHIRTENESARHILAESLGQLRDSLQNSGCQIEKLEVSCNPNQTNGNEGRENQSRHNETARNTAFGFDGNVENEGETAENNADRLVNLRA